MAELINLRMARKAKKRTEEQQAAAASRAKAGETKAAREKRKLDAARTARLIDGAKREDTT